ncbi:MULTISPECIES: YggS family pyridoxal phosphate-dependent enzyme [Croceibacter]|uniref:YggS family pyridoxal phosphate-dependent enzyme n=1 Tax=Croceibacter TaxID=216431 RepID=UPI000C6C2F26|nr:MULTISPECIES: YggS family pyridoxal phosphate-dependent enzyme [Croceibacter]MBG26936.1 YggS family pyridoxal phosphate-dependent enzyme [Croceibacter sp.]HAT70992.1 YggS family pyridoxal phosphate-dependent enzyme [Flavobacteriaceae bacterium]|tara:strand:+ start:3972 stop:4631 length:660 start_codon:yes stop_codon:yes gene_type:complete
MNISEQIKYYKSQLPEDVVLVAVSKTKPEEDLLEAYNAGQRVFGENKIQEMTEKWENLPKDIEWHMIGHVQSNKVKYMAEYVNLVHGIDRLKLIKELNKQAQKHDRTINCLLQIKIAEEDTKFGMDINDAEAILNKNFKKTYPNVNVVGFMGMATFTNDEKQVQREFKSLKSHFDRLSKDHNSLNILSMGMSGDYKLAITEGSTMVRIGSAIFGERNYN